MPTSPAAPTAELQLRVDGTAAWTAGHHMPLLWPWLFDWSRLTESRRVYTTAFDGADLFARRAAVVAPLAPWGSVAAALAATIRPDQFPRQLGVAPDAILSLDLAEFEARRPYRAEAAAAAWEEFFAVAVAGRRAAATAALERAALNPLQLTGRRQVDALHLAARATELGLETNSAGRAEALARLLFGQPMTRPARALSVGWAAALATVEGVAFVPARGLLGRWRSSRD